MSAPVSDLVARMEHDRANRAVSVYASDQVYALVDRISKLEAALARIVEDRFATRMDMVLIAHDALLAGGKRDG